jgi:signal transduction histidine kinase
LKDDARRRLSQSIWAITAVLAVVNVAMIVIGREALARSSGGDLFFDALGAVAGFLLPSIGLLIVVRARNVIGWILVVAGTSLGLETFSSAYVAVGLQTHPGSLPAPELVATVLQPMWIATLISLALMLLLFPVGSPPSTRWRPVLWLGVVGAGFAYLVTLLNPVPERPNTGIAFTNPLGIPRLGALISTALVGAAWTLTAVAVISFVGLVLRYRRGDAELRQQIKWLALAAAGVGICLLVALGSLVACGCDDTVVSKVAFLAFSLIVTLGIPAAIAIAVFKYRLYEIDLIISKALLYGLLAAFFTGVYVAIVIGIGAAVGSRGDSVLTIAAAVLIAVAFQPVRARARHLANRIVYGKRATPYEVLSEFSERVAGVYSSEEVLPRMAQILVDGTGATGARVWLRFGAQLRAAAAWPMDGEGASAVVEVAGDHPAGFPSAEYAEEVRHQGELLGALSVAMSANDPMNPSKAKLVRDLAAQAGLVLRNVRLIEELRSSRRRIVTAQDERAKALERNIHDGAQQQLVALSVKQRLVETMLDRDTDKARRLLADIQADTMDALKNLRDLARGIYPPLLADQGLAVALAAQARKTPLPVEIEADGLGRYAPEVEAAAYFCCLEALQNVAKYAEASHVTVRLSTDGRELSFAVVDDGRGFDPEATSFGTGMQGMADRMEALGGSLDVRSQPGQGTAVMGRVPAPAVEATPVK